MAIHALICPQSEPNPPAGEFIGEWRMIVAANRTAFGTSCARCRSYLIAPIRSQFVDDRVVSHEWYCECCDLTFAKATRCKGEAQVLSCDPSVGDEKAAA
jgi:hypothetical protein